MKTKNHCRKCGIEIEFDITNPYDLCDGCWEEKCKDEEDESKRL